MTNKYIFQ